MKAALATAVFTASILLFGCARNSLTLEKGSQQLAPVFGADAEELVFINHVLFTKLENEQQKDNEEILGYVAVTPAELVLGEGSPRLGGEGIVLKVALSDLEGFAAPFGPYVQLSHQGERYVVFPYRWFTDTSDFQRVNELAILLQEQEVPAVEAWKVGAFGKTSYVVAGDGGVLFEGTNPRPYGGPDDRFDLYTDGGYYNLDGTPIDTIPNEPAEPLFPVQLDNSLNETSPPYPEGRYPTTGQ